MKAEVFFIDSAIVVPEMQISSEAIRIPEPNEDYKFAMWHDDILFASKDGKKFVPAIAVMMIDGKPIYGVTLTYK